MCNKTCIFLSKKIVGASANCSQQHNVVVTAHAINLQESWRFHRILPGSSSVRAPPRGRPWGRGCERRRFLQFSKKKYSKTAGFGKCKQADLDRATEFVF